jgi:hypothetical protein
MPQSNRLGHADDLSGFIQYMLSMESYLFGNAHAGGLQQQD